MKTTIMLVTGLLVGLAATEAHAICQEGATASCWMPNGCPGIKECYTTQWGPCEPKVGNRNCTTACDTSGVQACNIDGQPTGVCHGTETCNNCDDDVDGQIDEGLVGCNGVTCGDTFEICGDWLDNDCDGGWDEGCSACTSATSTQIPFNFASINELRRDSVLESGAAVYGRYMDSDWRLLPSHRMSSFSLRFDLFAMESCCDSFFINSTPHTGLPGLPFTTQSFNISSGTSTWLGFSTDYSVQKSGVRTTHINAKCNNGGGRMFNTIDLNQGVDGVLLHMDDNAYATFWLPADREAFISLDHNFGSDPNIDFDMYVTWNATLFGTSCANSQACGEGIASTGEVVHLDAEEYGRTVKVNISSYSGAGRYRLFVASPVVDYGPAWDVDIGFDAAVPLNSAQDLRAKSEWAIAQRSMMAATDGQYRIKEHAYISRDVSCFICYDLIFSEDDTVSTPACTPGVHWDGGSLLFSFIEIPKSYWNGSSTWIDNGTVCPGAPFSPYTVADTIVHEWGHYDFQLPDEYDNSAQQRNRCGFSLMAGGSQPYEFCDAGLHGMNPASGATAMGGDDNWTDILDEYPQMSRPDGTGDFSRMTRLGEMMNTRNFVSFEEN